MLGMYLVITRLLGRSEKKVLVTAVGMFEEPVVRCTWSFFSNGVVRHNSIIKGLIIGVL